MQKRMNESRFDMDVKVDGNPGTRERLSNPDPLAGTRDSWVLGGPGAFAGTQRRFVGASGALHGMWLQDLRATK